MPYYFSIEFTFLILGNDLMRVSFTYPRSCSQVLESF